jgi:hypothetical protein
MVVARFTSATGWAGKSISYDNGQFALEDHGPVAVQDVLRYDQLGQLAWEYDGLREWVHQVAAATSFPAAAGAAGPPAVSGYPAQGGTGIAASPPQYSYPAEAQHSAVSAPPAPPGIAIAGFVLAIAGFVFPLGVAWWVGLGLSWAGYRQAVREQLPTGLALAGLIINAVMTVLSVIFLLILLLLMATSSS